MPTPPLFKKIRNGRSHVVYLAFVQMLPNRKTKQLPVRSVREHMLLILLQISIGLKFWESNRIVNPGFHIGFSKVSRKQVATLGSHDEEVKGVSHLLRSTRKYEIAPTVKAIDIELRHGVAPLNPAI